LVGDREGTGLTAGQVGVAIDGDIACVVLVVVGVTDEDEIVKFGGTTRCPRDDVVCLQPESVRASRHPASLVAEFE